MEAEARNVLFFFFFSFLTHSVTSDYQTLILRPLSNPSPPSWSDPVSKPESEPESATTVAIELHHFDSLSSNKTPHHLFNLRLQRDALRVNSLTSLISTRTRSTPRAAFSSSVISGLSQGSGEYFTRLGIGTPPKYSYLVLDTGSDVVWLQCSPCHKCYSQTDPIFNPSSSISFSKIPCGSPLCRRLDASGCNRFKTCLYQVSYGDGSYTTGDFSTETLTFRRKKLGRVALGCGHDNEGLFVGAAGLLGLGRGRLSFPSQTGIRFNRKFSYCLSDRSGSSKPSSLVFGDAAISRLARFTPLLQNPKLETFYYVELLGISVGGARVNGISGSLFKLDAAGNGGVIVDSGTSVTRLTRPAYTALRDAFRVGAGRLKRGPEFSLFDTCYDLSGVESVKVPTVVLHFRGADMVLPAANYLIPVDDGGSFCFAFAGTVSGLSIIGNIQQQGFRVVYDLAGSRIGFAPRGCT